MMQRNNLGISTAFLAIGLTLGIALPTCAQPGITVTPVGSPTWTPTDFHIFSNDLSTADPVTDFFNTISSLLPPPNHQPHPDLGIGPGSPHGPPYDTELSDGMVANNYMDSQLFGPADFDGQPNGVYFVFMNIPSPGAVGSSPDFAAGPIIPNSLFPISVAAPFFHEGVEVAVDAFAVPPLDNNLNPPFNVDGFSHFPLFFGWNSSFLAGTPLTGNFEWRVSMRDQQVNGYDIIAPFNVVPEPSTLGLVGMGIAGLAAFRSRARRARRRPGEG
jgi:hypothetical protein